MNIGATERQRRRRMVRRVERLAQANEISNKELAELIGVTKEMVNKYFRKGSTVVPAGSNYDAFIAAESLLRESNGKPRLDSVRRGIRAAHADPKAEPSGVSMRLGPVAVTWDKESRTVTLASDEPFTVQIA